MQTLTFDEEREAGELERLLSFGVLDLSAVLGLVGDLALLHLHARVHRRFVVRDDDARVGLHRDRAAVPVHRRRLLFEPALHLHRLACNSKVK